MATLSRREVLRNGLLSAVSITLGGCASLSGSSPNGTDTSPTTATPTSENPSAASPEDILILLDNGTSAEITVHVTITEQGSILTEKELQVSSGGFAQVNSKIEDLGNYELAVDVDGREKQTYSFDIGEYNLRTGSNVWVWIAENQISFGIED